MNNFYADNKIPLDFVYTGKMMFGVYDSIKENYFAALQISYVSIRAASGQ